MKPQTDPKVDYAFKHVFGREESKPALMSLLDALPASLNVPEVRWAMGDLMMISQSGRERELYESRLKMRRDMNANREEGRAVGLEEGRAVGLEEGRAEERRAFIRSLQESLHKDVMSVEQLQAFSLSELESLISRLQAELKAKLTGGS